MSRGLRGFGGLDVALNGIEPFFVLLGAPFAILRAQCIVFALPLVGARVAPVGKARCQHGVQRPFGNLGISAPLLDARLLIRLIDSTRVATQGQRLQKFCALHHAGGQRQQLIRGQRFFDTARLACLGCALREFKQAHRQRFRFGRRGLALRYTRQRCVQGGDGRINGAEPTGQRLCALTLLPHSVAELRAQCRKLSRQRGIEQRAIQRGPRAIQIQHPIDRHERLLDQCTGAGDQAIGLFRSEPFAVRCFPA